MSEFLHRFDTDFAAQVIEKPDAVAIVDGRTENQFTWRELDVLTLRIGETLAATGLQCGDTVLSVLPNTVEKLCIYLTCIRYGLNFAPLPLNASRREIETLRSIVPSKLCFALPDLEEPGVRTYRPYGEQSIHPAVDGTFKWTADVSECSLVSEDGAATESCLFVPTSGSTGDPKVMVIDNNTLWSSAKAWTSFHSFLGSDCRFYNNMPMSYLGGLFNLCLIPLACGGSTVVADASAGTAILRFWHEVARFEINTLWLVPTLVNSLLQLTGKHWPTIKRSIPEQMPAFVGTAPISLELKTAFETIFGIDLLENFALSETTFITSETMDSRRNRIPGSVGEVLPYVDVQFAKTNVGAPAVIEVRTPFLLKGYLGQDGETALDLSDDGFFRTGDLGHVAEAGQVVLEGRSRDIVKKGGVFIHLAEIERITRSAPVFADTAAVQVESTFYGEDYVLFAVSADVATPADMQLTEARKWISQNLVQAKWPASIQFVDEIPRTRSGKVSKGALRHLLPNCSDRAS